MNKKIKIAFVEQSKIFSGAEMSLHSLVAYLNPNLFESHIFFQYPMEHQKRYEDLTYTKHFLTSGIQWWMGSERWKKPIRGSDFLKRAIFGFKLALNAKKEGINLIHINLITPKTSWCVWFSKLFGMKVVAHSRSDPMNWIPSEELQKQCDAIVCVSDFVKDKVMSKYSNPSAHTVYDPVDFDHYTHTISKPEALTSLQIEAGKRLLSSVGLLSPHKGHDMAIRVFARLSKKISDIVLLIAGGGNNAELARLKKLVKDFDLEKSIRFTEKQIANVAEVYRASDLVFSLTTRGEAFGRVPFEAMACEAAVIAPAKGAAVELISDDKTGFIVDPLDEEAVYKKAFEILENESKTKTIVQQGISHFEQKLSPKTSAMMLEEIYLSLMKKNLDE